MKLFSLEVSQWDIVLNSYFGDIYLRHRTWLLALAVIVVLRLAKVIRKKAKK